jgi:hypothetical protein
VGYCLTCCATADDDDLVVASCSSHRRDGGEGACGLLGHAARDTAVAKHYEEVGRCSVDRGAGCGVIRQWENGVLNE